MEFCGYHTTTGGRFETEPYLSPVTERVRPTGETGRKENVKPWIPGSRSYAYLSIRQVEIATRDEAACPGCRRGSDDRTSDNLHAPLVHRGQIAKHDDLSLSVRYPQATGNGNQSHRPQTTVYNRDYNRLHVLRQFRIDATSKASQPVLLNTSAAP